TSDETLYVNEAQLEEDSHTERRIISIDRNGKTGLDQVTTTWAPYTDIVRDPAILAVITLNTVNYLTTDNGKSNLPTSFVPYNLAFQADGSILVLGAGRDLSDAVDVYRLFRDDAPAAVLNAKTLARRRSASYRFNVQ